MERKVVCVNSFSGERFTVPYDKLVVAVGAKSQTFGIKGVGEFAVRARVALQHAAGPLRTLSRATTSEHERVVASCRSARTRKSALYDPHGHLALAVARGSATRRAGP